MKQNYKKLLMILPVLPLMMANSPARMPTFNYTDFNMTLVSEELVPEGYNYYRYNYHVTNLGDGYIEEIYRYNNNYYDYQVFYPGCNDSFFNNQIIGPHGECDFYFNDYQFDTRSVSFSANAYTEFSSDAILKGSLEIQLFDEPSYYYDYARYGYFIDLQIRNINVNKYNYHYILNLEYDDVKYSMIVYDSFIKDDKEGITFYSSQKLDLSKLKFQENPLLVAQELNPYYKEPSLNVMAMLIALGVGVGCAAIFCAIYFPLKARKKKQNE